MVKVRKRIPAPSLREKLIREIKTDFHKIELDELCARFDTNINVGLSFEDAKFRLAVDGPNELTPLYGTPKWIKFMKNLFGGFALMLWVGSLLCFFGFVIQYFELEDPPNDNLFLGLALVVFVIITGFLSYYEESRILKIMDMFKNLLPPFANAIREGEHVTIPAVEVVMGDLVEIKSGDHIPADIRIIESNCLKVDNFLLTGESEPQARGTEFTHENPLETKNLVFFTTNVIEGKAKGIVIACGNSTVMGRIAHLATDLDTVDTPIFKELRYFVYLTTMFGTLMGVIFFISALLLGYEFIEAIIFFIGIIVANVPEGLIFTATICLALAVKRMTLKNCMIKTLKGVEKLGSTSTICSNKTGTMTQNYMTVSHIWINNKIMEARTSEENQGIGTDISEKTFAAILLCSILCNNAQFKSVEHSIPIPERNIIGNPLEAALLKYTEIVLGDTSQVRKSYEKLIEIPFNSTNKYQMSIHLLHDHPDAYFLLVMKGAPEHILECCNSININGYNTDITSDIHNKYNESFIFLGSLGERVLGFCDYALPKNKYPKHYKFSVEPVRNFPMKGMRFLGLISLTDRPRAAVPDAIRKCRLAGIKVIMVTGDHPSTAKAVAKSVGIITHPTIEEIASTRKVTQSSIPASEVMAVVLAGYEIDKMKSSQLDTIIGNHKEIVFARTSPEHKVLIVESCQRCGEIVAVTGDGVNDLPALKIADIGIAKGITGSDVSKQVADVVLLDDNFASIVVGVEEGRVIFDNLKKSVAYTLTSNVPEIAPFVVFAGFNIPLPLNAIAILCIDLGTDMLPAISLAYEKAESDIMKRSPRDIYKDKLVNRKLIMMTYLQIGIIEASAGFLTYFTIMAEHGFYPAVLVGIRTDWENKNKDDVHDSFGQEWTYGQRKALEFTCNTAFFAAIVVTQWANLIICKTRRSSIIRQGMTNHVLNFALIFETLVAMFLCYLPGMKKALHMYPLQIHWWFLALPFAVVIIVYDELRRYFIRCYPGGWVERETYY